ncbi:MAG: calcium-translocating P-type ATPase, PMCA-type [Bacilli bacterium]|nr:calcium-translocating P-type ATPase, PMCA-type [Bacilli bacterium]
MELNGLNDDEVKINRKKYGINNVSNNKNNSFFSLLLESFGDPIIKILLIALAVKVIFLFRDFDWFETLGILIAIFLSSFISTISEYGSEKAFKRLQEESSNILVKVKRNGNLVKVNISEVVVNDIVIVESGDLVPADGIVLKGNLLVDESALNGETKEVEKSINNEILKGSIICDGEGYLKITKVGKNTIYGNIETEVMEKTIDSPLRTRLGNLAKVISKIGYVGSVLVVISYLFSVIVINNNYDIVLIMETLSNPTLMIDYLIYSLTLCVTVIIVAVPEGLPMMVALVLSSNMKRMLKSNVLVRKMVGIETAGSINILFTDKTGTITNGKLSVKKIINYKGEVCDNLKYKNIFLDSLLYNNQSNYNNGNVIGGNSTDQAIINYIKKEKQEDYEHVVLFNSKNKYSVTKLVNKNIYYFKGANEVIIDNCDYYLDELGYKQILKDKSKLYSVINNLTKSGLRVISVAYSNNSTLGNLCFIGFVVIKDEIRENAKEGIKYVNDAYVQTVMITGDDKETATSIGKEIGLISNNKDIILTHDELSKMSDKEISDIIIDLRIVARALPQDKSRLVKIAQSKGLVVGMTGDGVNDAPALKVADVGFSMGSGTEIAKESSDIVILDNNLISIANAILYGRTIFKSIRKFVIYQLSVNCCALILSIIGPLIGISTPITVVQMLWINMIMDTLAGLAFSYEAPLNEYMKETPKKRNESIINKFMYAQILLTGIYTSCLSIFFLSSDIIKNIFRYNKDNIYIMTGFFALFIFLGIFNAFNARTTRINLFSNIKKNKVFILLFSCISIVQLYLIYFGGSLFRTYGLSFKELLIVFLMAFSIIPIDIIRKLLFKRKGVFDYI